MRVQVTTRLDESGHAEVEVYDSVLDAPAGGRRIDSEQPGCANLQSQLTLVLGILVEAGRGAPVQTAPPTPPPAPPPEPPPPEELLEEQGFERPRTRRSLRIGPRRTHTLGLVATAGWGQLPGAYPGGELRWSVHTRKGLPIRMAGSFDGPGTTSLNPGHMRFFAARFSLGICPEWPWGAVRVGVCGVANLGTTVGQSTGLGTDERNRGPAFSLGAEGFVVLPLAGPVELVLGMQALAVPYRPRFAYRELDGTRHDAFQPAPVSVRGHGGLQLRFW